MHHTTTAEGKQLLEEAKGCLVWLIGSADSDSHPPARASFSLDLFVNRAPALIREGSMDWRHLADWSGATGCRPIDPIEI